MASEDCRNSGSASASALSGRLFGISVNVSRAGSYAIIEDRRRDGPVRDGSDILRTRMEGVVQFQ